MGARDLLRIVWSPQPGPQKALIDCPLSEIFFGGARGGGKTDGVLGKYGIKQDIYGQHFNAVFFRKEMPQQDDLVERAKEIYLPLGATWLEQRKQFRFKKGGRVRFRPLENVVDAQKYQGQNLTDAAVEEVGNYADPAPIDMLFGALRSATGVPTQLILTGNPGGPGHQWIKIRYIDPAPLGMKVLRRKLPNGAEHSYVYIPSRVQQNRLLLARDPSYINRLYLVGSAELVRAWLEGDWNVIQGAFFDRWSGRMVLRPFPVPPGWTRFRSLDWGYAQPFSCGWWALVEDEHRADSQVGEVVLPRGALLRYREWYGVKRKPDGIIEPNVGLRLDAEEVAHGIIERELEEKIAYGVADPAMWGTQSGPSPIERMLKYRHPKHRERQVYFRQADNKRIAAKGALGGWDQLRARMRGYDEEEPPQPMIYTFSTCTDSIRTIPTLQHDLTKPEDLDTEQEDHCFAAGTRIRVQGIGEVGIADAPWSGVVLTRFGWRSYYDRRMTRERALTVRLSFSDGRTVDCTPDHLLMTVDGRWIEAQDFAGEWSYTIWTPSSSAKPSKSSTASAITAAADTFSAAAFAFIAWCGRLRTDRFPQVITSITSTETPRTIGARTWRYSIRARIFGTTTVLDPSTPLATLRRAGMVRSRAERGTRGITPGTSSRSWIGASLQRAWSAAALTFAQLRARNRASSVPVPARLVRCVSVAPWKRQPVYCLTVPDGGEFCAEGIVVANCADEWRYACMSRPFSRATKPKPARPHPHSVVNIFAGDEKPRSKYRA